MIQAKRVSRTIRKRVTQVFSLNKGYQHVILYNQPLQTASNSYQQNAIFTAASLDSACGQVHILSQVLVNRTLICTLH